MATRNYRGREGGREGGRGGVREGGREGGEGGGGREVREVKEGGSEGEKEHDIVKCPTHFKGRLIADQTLLITLE